MSELNMTIQSGVTRVLHTAGKYCDRDIVVTAEKGDGYENGYNEGVEAGKKAEHDAFWDMWQENGNRTDYTYGFAYSNFNDDFFKPKYPLQPTNANNMFLGANGITSVFVDLSKATSVTWTFRAMKNITHIGKCDFSSATNVDSTFGFNETSLVSIEEIVSHKELLWNNAFVYDSVLKDVTFSGVIGTNFAMQHCNKLSSNTVQSIIDHLADLTGATAQTLTFHAYVGGKLTDEQKAAITAKNWTLVY